jgi:hypothetical protein
LAHQGAPWHIKTHLEGRISFFVFLYRLLAYYGLLHEYSAVALAILRAAGAAGVSYCWCQVLLVSVTALAQG